VLILKFDFNYWSILSHEFINGEIFMYPNNKWIYEVYGDSWQDIYGMKLRVILILYSIIHPVIY